MKHHYIYIFIFSILIISCSPRISSSLIKNYPTLEYNDEVVVLELDDKRPDNSEVLGSLKIGDTGFSTKCNYDIVLDNAKLEARKFGGNAIMITKHKKPDFWSTCHRIQATILRIKN